jgi:hypothetical protein
MAAIFVAAMSALALTRSYFGGWTLWYGDAEAHLNIARRVVDARSPGYEQIGTVWLPLPHLLMLPGVWVDALWRSGLGGALPAAACFVAGGVFLFLAVRRLMGGAAAAAGVAAYATNPNLLYLQSAPMTESMAICWLLGLLYFTVRFSETDRWSDAVLAAAMACCGTLTRYEGWFFLPFAAAYVLVKAKRSGFAKAAVFCVIAGMGPLFWFGHNLWLYGDPLEFYRGEWSAKAIYQRALDKGGFRYPGDHDWGKAWLYYRTAAESCAGRPLAWMGAAGVFVALWKRAWWAVGLTGLAGVFYVVSLYSSGTPIFVPSLWPNTHYNTRYGLAVLPMLCVGAAAWAALLPGRAKSAIAGLVAVAAVSPWLLYPRKENWVCWREAQQNSEERRAWTAQAATWLEGQYGKRDGVLLSFGDPTGVIRAAGIPLKEALHAGDGPMWMGAVRRPDVLMRERWALSLEGDAVSEAMSRGRYVVVRKYKPPHGAAVEIWERPKR